MYQRSKYIICIIIFDLIVLNFGKPSPMIKKTAVYSAIN